MGSIKKILVACDLSKNTSQVLNYAAKIGAKLESKLLLVHIINQRDIDAIEYATHRILVVDEQVWTEKYIDDFLSERKQRLRELIAETQAAGMFLNPIVKIGVPFHELIEIGKSEYAELVIIGAGGRTSLFNTLIGSTAEKLFRHCPIPLLCVR